MYLEVYEEVEKCTWKLLMSLLNVAESKTRINLSIIPGSQHMLSLNNESHCSCKSIISSRTVPEGLHNELVH
jgi:hypothetical protein